MSIDIDPYYFQKHDDSVYITPQVYSNKDLESIRKKETEIRVKGDIFIYSGVNFSPMTRDELINEKIDMKSLKLTSTTTSEKITDDRIVIAFRDPSNPKNIIAYKLDEEIIDELKSSFSSDNFFQREDGILRLNSKAEAYVAGWVQDIKVNRGYEKADVNGNGYIEKDEQDELNVSFERSTDYTYLGEKIVTANTAIGAKTYQKYGYTNNALDKANILNTSSLMFENTIEKELSHTLQLDKDKDGTITLREGLEDFTPPDISVDTALTRKVKINHDRWVFDNDIVLDHTKVESREIYDSEINKPPDELTEAMLNANGKEAREIEAMREADRQIQREKLKEEHGLTNMKYSPIAYDYFDLGKDISQYQNIDPIQEQTNEEIVNYLTSFINHTTSEGNKNLKSLDTFQYSSAMDMEWTEEEFRATEKKVANVPIYEQENDIDTRNFLSPYISNIFTRENFQNIYSLTDEFAQTERFETLYVNYNLQKGEQEEKIKDSGKKFFDLVDSKEYITSEIVKHAFSKTEAIEYFTSINDELKEYLATRTNMQNTFLVKDMKESIKLYDKITMDLKVVWGFSGLDTSV
ncbi:MAG: hypothetical protein ACI9TV_002385 [Sulfurimonas sp.]|jgi:hypothetical protein|uniref:hypothetical protein n=1 Tax=Sulfurimonas sp. TaxID=2022749 RepID=UPI0039E37F6D